MIRSSASSFHLPVGARSALCAIVLVAGACSRQGETGAEESTARPLNVLFVVVDDLGCELGCYGVEGLSTPHVDRLAAGGILFEAAYCQSSICNPSRSAMLTGCRPETNGVRDLHTFYRDALPECVVLPELFRRDGYVTRALGKVHHGDGRLDDERAWSEGCWRPERWQRYYASPRAQELVRRRREEEKDNPLFADKILAWERPDVPDTELPDGMIADEAIRFLHERREQPFFLAVGFLKPHLPFVAPRRYWDLYPDEETRLSPCGIPPIGAPAVALHDSPEVRSYENVPDEGPLPATMQRRLLRGYRACASFVDAQLGRVLEALDAEGLTERTIVVVWGDHGWHLGDLGMWGKHTNYESAVRSPLILSVPGVGRAGARCARLVESVDLYPTLAELCGLDAPDGLEGTSLVPLLEDPTREWKRAAFSEYTRAEDGIGAVRGRAMRTPTHRAVEWARPEKGFLEIEVYEYGEVGVERVNLSTDEASEELTSRLLDELHAGWRAAVPETGHSAADRTDLESTHTPR